MRRFQREPEYERDAKQETSEPALTPNESQN